MQVTDQIDGDPITCGKSVKKLVVRGCLAAIVILPILTFAG